jgi:hypothetical protein
LAESISSLQATRRPHSYFGMGDSYGPGKRGMHMYDGYAGHPGVLWARPVQTRAGPFLVAMSFV